MQVYSPSATRTYAECPRKRYLQKKGLTSKYAAKSAVARWMGTAMAAGLEQHNRMRAFAAPSLVTPYRAAAVKWEEQVAQFLDAGGVVTDETFETRIPPLMQRALEHYVAHDVVPAEWEIAGVEQTFERAGNARPDLIVIDADGYAPVDYKMKESLYTKPTETKDAARARTLAEYDNDWQLLHYVWCIRRFIGQPCTHYYVVLGELSPKPQYTLQRFEVSEARIQSWIDNAHQWWANMYETEIDHINLPRMSPTHDSKYGACEYQYACLDAEGDEERYKHKYVTIERRS